MLRPLPPTQRTITAHAYTGIAAGWPYQVSALKGVNFPIGAVIPKEGVTGWADTWMLAAKAPHPNCAYMWMRYISTPQVQAEQAVSYGETPDNKLACPLMDKIQKGSCAQYHANAPLAYFKSVSLWKTPVATCDNGNLIARAAEVRPDMRVRWPRLSAALWRRPWARATLLLTPALAWFVLIYLAALVVLLITAFWRINAFTTNIERVWNLGNFTLIFQNPAYRDIVLRTVGIAAGVTVVDAIIAFPFAYYMARLAGRRTRTFLYVAILLPLWASYLAKVYAWLLIFTHDGLLNWTLGNVGVGPVNLIYTNWAVFIVFCYVWLPFMIIPVYAALERIPPSQIEASQDLGARTWRTLRLVILPLVLPGLVAGSIFTFSLTLGDFITPLLVGGASSQLIGNAIYSNIGLANNLPFAATLALVPIVIMGVYLLGARALGAFEAL